VLDQRSTSDAEDRERAARLARAHGRLELRCVLLALLLTPASVREMRAWRDETLGLPSAASLLGDVQALAAMARLPWFELFAERAGQAPPNERSELVEAARRVMQADRRFRPQDRLWWLLLRHRLGDAPAATLGGANDNDLSRFDIAQVNAVATFSAFLSRLVPVTETASGLAAGGAPLAIRWYNSVMARWEPQFQCPPRQLPDGDALMRSLRVLQGLPWLQKPLLVRNWFDAAQLTTGRAPLRPAAADALRVACGLLDSPLPPGLAEHYIEPVRNLRAPVAGDRP